MEKQFYQTNFIKKVLEIERKYIVVNSNKILFQHGTLGTLMAGLYDGTFSINELLSHGNMGIGTLDVLDGELIVLDGEAFQAKSDGTIVKLSGKELVPYAAVTYFEGEKYELLENEMTSEEVKTFLREKMSSLNTFSAIKIKGHFKKMHVRIIPKQEKPYQRFINASRMQPEYTQTDVEGTIVGFFAPDLFQGATVAGFHLHFIDKDQQFGGHILDFVLEKGVLEIQTLETLEQHFQIHDETFLKSEFDETNLHEEIQESEG